MARSSDTKSIVILLSVYVASYGPYALVNVPFWDDWVILQYGMDGLWEFFQQLGRREHYIIMAPLVAAGNPLVWALANFICWGGVAVSVYFVVKSMGWGLSSAFWISVLTAALPMNQARFALAMFPYSFSALAFAMGLALLAASVRNGRLLPRLVGVVCLTYSFSTNSFVVLSALAPIVVFVTFLNLRPGDVRGALWVTLKRVELFIAPFAYWFVKSSFQKPYGLYENYNAIKINPLTVLLESIGALIAQFPEISTLFPAGPYRFEAYLVGAGFISVFVIALLLAKAPARLSKVALPFRLWVFAGACVAAMLAIFPYVAVGIRPAYYALWETRHQVTLAVIAGLLIFAAYRLILPARLMALALTFTLFCFVVLNVSTSRQLMADVYESNAIIHSPAIASIADGTLVGVFEDDRPYRMMLRHFQFYDLSSMLNAHSNTKAIVAMSNLEVVEPASGTYVAAGSDYFPKAVDDLCSGMLAYPQYGFGDVVANGTYADVRLVPGSPPPGYLAGLANVLGLVFQRDQTIERAVADLDVQVETRPYSQARCGLDKTVQ